MNQCLWPWISNSFHDDSQVFVSSHAVYDVSKNSPALGLDDGMLSLYFPVREDELFRNPQRRVPFRV